MPISAKNSSKKCLDHEMIAIKILVYVCGEVYLWATRLSTL